MTETGPITNVSKPDANIANSGPAPWTNKFMVMLGPMVKIVFMEQGGPDEELFFRSAVSMSHQDAIALKTLLARILSDIEKQYEAAQAKDAGSGTPSHG